MKRRTMLFLVLVSMGFVGGGLGLLALSEGSAEAPPPREERPFRDIIYETMEGGGMQRCFADAHVHLVDGVISEVVKVAPDKTNDVRVGLRPEGVPGGFAVGRTEFAVPVYIDNTGRLVGGSSECVQLEDQAAP